MVDTAEFRKRAVAADEVAKVLPEGFERDDLLRKARALRTSAELMREQEERRARHAKRRLDDRRASGPASD
jgi:hypothetical protein